MLALLILEDQTDQMKTEVEPASSGGGAQGARTGHPPASESAKFYPGHPVSAQPMLLNAIVGALKQVRTLSSQDARAAGWSAVRGRSVGTD